MIDAASARALPPPVRQERRVQPLATQQGAHLAGPLARVDFLEDAEPIRGGGPGPGHAAGPASRVAAQIFDQVPPPRAADASREYAICVSLSRA